MKENLVHQVAIIGAGQLGSRHLQALALLDHQHQVTVLEPNPANRERALGRWNEVASATSPELTWASSIDDLPKQLVVAIIATSSDTRRVATAALLKHSRVEHLVLEKVLFDRVSDYAPMLAAVAAATTTAWVNCPRRMWSFYDQLRTRLHGERRVSVSGSQWGLGSAAVHFLDLFAFLGGGDELAVDGLHVAQVASRRPGFIELTGELTGASPHGRFAFSSFGHGELPLIVEVATPDLRALVPEGEGKVWIATAADKWAWTEQAFEVVPQSKLTNLIVADLIARGNCGLTPFVASTRHHLAFLQPLANLLGEDRCPVT